ncbi:MAG: hypothetical protein A2Z34_10180 [Planctomycetes bacterium RBG_16_59_8]|nr:MAG: hypothetical protein A2Z34_10180 [Planctomycetes bacterium RBG_16_59_8]
MFSSLLLHCYYISLLSPFKHAFKNLQPGEKRAGGFVVKDIQGHVKIDLRVGETATVGERRR